MGESWEDGRKDRKSVKWASELVNRRLCETTKLWKAVQKDLYVMKRRCWRRRWAEEEFRRNLSGQFLKVSV